MKKWRGLLKELKTKQYHPVLDAGSRIHMIIVPALLETIIQTFEINVKRLVPFYSRFQVDITDGVFVPNKTIQITDIANLHSLAHPETIFDFHLMVNEPIKYIEEIKALHGITLGTILIHKSVFPSYPLIPNPYSLIKFGLVLSPEDTVESIESGLLMQLPAIQIMTVSPGFQGSPFVENTLIKIEQLRKAGFKGEILIDGAVNEKTIATVLARHYKPDVLGVGSYLTKSPKEDLERRVGYLKRAIFHL